jgi:hypothetical protein
MTNQIPVTASEARQSMHSGVLDCFTAFAMTNLFMDWQGMQTKVLRLGGPGAGIELAGALRLPLPGAGHTLGIGIDEIEGTASGINRLLGGIGEHCGQGGKAYWQPIQGVGLQGQMAVLAHDLAGQGVKFACL